MDVSSRIVHATAAAPDVWVLPLVGDRKPFPIVQSQFIDTSAAFSPDGKWIAYTSNEGGESNVYVQAFPSADAKYQVSRDGGSHPVWRADGKELFYLLGVEATLMAVPIDTSARFEAGMPQALFPSGAARLGASPAYAVTKDGKRFLVNARRRQSSEAPLTVVVNWTATIQK